MRERFVTPEAVVVEAELAGLGSRFIGAFVDAFLQGGLLLIASVMAQTLPSDAGLVLLVVTSFTVLFVYPTALETATRGRTVGKMVARTRVRLADGRPVTFPVVLVRNLLRLVDFLPSFYAVGAVCILVTRRAQRLGDLAAGTVVAYEAPVRPPEVLEIAERPALDEARRGMDVAAITPDEYALVRSFLLRRASLEPHARDHLATNLRDRLRAKVGSEAADVAAELFLEAIAAAYRDRRLP
jgi:uncharacterized RDD family membrane protein YckC